MKKLGILIVIIVLGALGYKALGRSQTALIPAVTAPAPVQTTTRVSLSLTPSPTLQGEPARIVINGTTTQAIKSLTWNGKVLTPFIYKGEVSALIGVDLKLKPGTYPLVLTLADGKKISKNLSVTKRTITEAPLGIPDSLGGNTPQAAQNLVNTLAKENAELNSIPSIGGALWAEKFGYPVANPVVTDVYGYSRQTAGASISHKGTDFHAPPGTPVLAMNTGIVRVTKMYTAYGNTIIIDHGAGVLTLYMHLSKIDAKVGDKVTKGQVIGKSGETGYAEGPHLHVSVKVGGISIDPEAFLKLF
jgi:murein DD-endopeptidase MepM/ murein hydrolase activator NlpD